MGQEKTELNVKTIVADRHEFRNGKQFQEKCENGSLQTVKIILKTVYQDKPLKSMSNPLNSSSTPSRASPRVSW